MKPEIPLWLKIGFTIWIGVWAPLYATYKDYGLPTFLWFCDIANFMIVVALWKESRLIFSWQAVSVLLVQLTWTVDLGIGLATGKFPFGAAHYMLDPSYPVYIRLLSLFHLMHPPILIWALSRLGYDRRAWLAQTLTALVILPIGWSFGGYRNLNWTWAPFGRQQHVMAPWLYLVACMVVYPVALYGVSHLALKAISKWRKWGVTPSGP